jgi:hypothetical protein
MIEVDRRAGHPGPEAPADDVPRAAHPGNASAPSLGSKPVLWGWWLVAAAISLGLWGLIVLLAI